MRMAHRVEPARFCKRLDGGDSGVHQALRTASARNAGGAVRALAASRRVRHPCRHRLPWILPCRSRRGDCTCRRRYRRGRREDRAPRLSHRWRGMIDPGFVDTHSNLTSLFRLFGRADVRRSAIFPVMPVRPAETPETATAPSGSARRCALHRRHHGAQLGAQPAPPERRRRLPQRDLGLRDASLRYALRLADAARWTLPFWARQSRLDARQGHSPPSAFARAISVP